MRLTYDGANAHVNGHDRGRSSCSGGGTYHSSAVQQTRESAVIERQYVHVNVACIELQANLRA